MFMGEPVAHAERWPVLLSAHSDVAPFRRRTLELKTEMAGWKLVVAHRLYEHAVQIRIDALAF
jgi:hypothetical protein